MLSKIIRKTSNINLNLQSNIRNFSGFSFEMTDEQKSYRDLARNFARDEIIPVAAAYDKNMKFPHDVFKKAWELGLVNAHIPTQYGGLGLHTVI